MQKAKRRLKRKAMKQQQACLSKPKGKEDQCLSKATQGLDEVHRGACYFESHDQSAFEPDERQHSSKELCVIKNRLTMSSTTNCQYVPSPTNLHTGELQKHLQEAVQENRCYRRRLQEQEKRVKLITREYRRSVLSIRHFWKDKIYRECARGGKILKMAIRNNVASP